MMHDSLAPQDPPRRKRSQPKAANNGEKTKARAVAKAKARVIVNWEGLPVPKGKKRDRMEHIDKALQVIRRRERGGHFHGKLELPNAVQFAQELRVKAPRTIQRLIQEMQDAYGMPIRFNTSRGGYEYTEDVAFSPLLQLSESELVAVYLSQQLAAFEGTPFRARLKSAFRKMLGLFGAQLSFDPALLDECFSFDADGPHARFRPEHLDACARAMLRQEELVLNYTKQHGEGAGVPEIRRVRPLHITYRDFAYYVLCQDLKRSELRLFMVSRMNGVEETKVKFARPKDFDARAYLEKAFKVFASKEGVRVELEFAPSARARVMERRWHSTQKFVKLEGGGVRMIMQVGLAPDLYSWIGGFFGECRAVAPGELQETMRRLHNEALRGYEGIEGALLSRNG